MELSLAEILAGYKRRWWLFLVALVVALGGAAGLIAFSPPVYRAEVEFVYVPPPSSSSNETRGGALSGLFSLVGPGSGNADHAQAIAMLRAKWVLSAFVRRHALLPLLFPQDWNSAGNRWRDPAQRITDMDGAIKLREKALKLNDKSDDEIIKLSLDLSSRIAVAPTVNMLLKEIDARLRSEAILESRRNFSLLRRELVQSTDSALRYAITNLMQAEMQRAALIQTRGAYSFRVIDPAITPIAPIWPRKSLIIALATVMALLFAAVLSALIDIISFERRRLDQ